VLAVVALHVIATAVLLNTDMTFWALEGTRGQAIWQNISIELTHVFRMSTDIICSLAVICTFSQPPLYDFTIRGRMIVDSTFETKKENYERVK